MEKKPTATAGSPVFKAFVKAGIGEKLAYTASQTIRDMAGANVIEIMGTKLAAWRKEMESMQKTFHWTLRTNFAILAVLMALLLFQAREQYSLNREVATLSQAQVAIREDVAELGQEVTEIRHDVTELGHEVTELRQGVAGLRGDVATLSRQVAALTRAVTALGTGSDEVPGATAKSNPPAVAPGNEASADSP